MKMLTRTKEETLAFYEGMKCGIIMYSWWRDGVQYVGTTGKTLKEAAEAVNKDEAAALKRFEDK